MSKNSVKQMIQQFGEDYWFEIYSKNNNELIVDGRDCYSDFDKYYNEQVHNVKIDFPNDEKLQVIKLYIK